MATESIGTKGKIIAYSTMILLAVVFIFLSLEFAHRGAQYTYGIYGPAFFPVMMLSLILLFNGILIAKELKNAFKFGEKKFQPARTKQLHSIKRALLFWIMGLGYAIAWQIAGFIVASALFVGTGGYFLGLRSRWGGLSLVVVVIILWFLFRQLSIRL